MTLENLKAASDKAGILQQTIDDDGRRYFTACTVLTVGGIALLRHGNRHGERRLVRERWGALLLGLVMFYGGSALDLVRGSFAHLEVFVGALAEGVAIGGVGFVFFGVAKPR